MEKLNNIQQLQLTQILADYFTGEHDFNLLCSVFMIIFMVQGKDVEFKVGSLSRLLSYALSVNSVTILNFGGVWLTQQSPTSAHSLNVARLLVSHTVTSVSHGAGQSALPAQSPLFTTNLIAAIGEVYSDSAGERRPVPVGVVSLVSDWLAAWSQHSTADTGSPLSLPTPETSPAAALLPWTVLCHLDTNEVDPVYSKLHHTLLDIIISSTSSQLPVKYLTQLTSSLLTRLDTSDSVTPERRDRALDCYGQIVAAALAGDKLKMDKDLLASMKKLPENRLVQIVISSHSNTS